MIDCKGMPDELFADDCAQLSKISQGAGYACELFRFDQGMDTLKVSQFLRRQTLDPLRAAPVGAKYLDREPFAALGEFHDCVINVVVALGGVPHDPHIAHFTTLGVPGRAILAQDADNLIHRIIGH